MISLDLVWSRHTFWIRYSLDIQDQQNRWLYTPKPLAEKFGAYRFSYDWNDPKNTSTQKKHTHLNPCNGVWKNFSPKKPPKKGDLKAESLETHNGGGLHLCMEKNPLGTSPFMTRRRMRQKRLERRISKSRWPVGPLGWVVDEDFGPGGSEELKVLCCC